MLTCHKIADSDHKTQRPGAAQYCRENSHNALLLLTDIPPSHSTVAACRAKWSRHAMSYIVRQLGLRPEDNDVDTFRLQKSNLRSQKLDIGIC